MGRSGRVVNGMHVANAGSQSDIEQMLRAAPGAVTILHYQLKSQPRLTDQTGREIMPAMWADDENCNWYGKLRYGFAAQGISPAPNRIIHIRAYQPNWTLIPAEKWAENLVTLLSDWRGSREHATLREDLFLDPYVIISFANEQNLHYECGDPNENNQWKYQTVEWYEKIARWNLNVLDRVRQLYPVHKCLFGTSAFAFGHEPPGYPADGEYTIPAVRDMLDAFDITCLHPYARADVQADTGAHEKLWMWYGARDFRPVGYEGGHDIGGIIAQRPHDLYALTECGTFVHNRPEMNLYTQRHFDTLYQKCADSGRVVFATPFIWNSDDGHAKNRIHTNKQLRNFFETMNRYEAAVWPQANWKENTVPVPPQPSTPPPPAFDPNPRGLSVGPGFLQYAAAHGLTVYTDELYFLGPNSKASYAFCDGGMLVYQESLGVNFIPFGNPKPFPLG